MKFSAASILALAATAMAAPAPGHGGHGNKCGHPYCTDLLDVVIDVDLDVCLNVGGLLGIHLGLDLDVDLAIKTCHGRGGHKVYCCPDECEYVSLQYPSRSISNYMSNNNRANVSTTHAGSARTKNLTTELLLSQITFLQEKVMKTSNEKTKVVLHRGDFFQNGFQGNSLTCGELGVNGYAGCKVSI